MFRSVLGCSKRQWRRDTALFPTPERRWQARRLVDRTGCDTYIFSMAIHRLNLPGAPPDPMLGPRQTAPVAELNYRAREVLRRLVKSYVEPCEPLSPPAPTPQLPQLPAPHPPP